MSLQDKKRQLLGHDDAGDDAVDDIFAQYGVDDDAPITPVMADDHTAQSTDDADTDESNPIDDAVNSLNEGVEVEVPDPKNDSVADVGNHEDEKQWERNVEKNGVAHTPSQDDAVAQSQIVSAPVNANQNSVMEGVPQQKTKKSYVPKKDVPKREIHIDPSKKTIMIVDDDIDTLEMYADIFENADYNVIRAVDGLEALNLISDHTPHLIFTGIVMPRMDGFSMMESLKQNQRTADIPVVINSHLGRAQDKKKAEDLGAKDFIVRGFTPPREAVERIGALLMRSEYTFRFNHTDPEARKLAKDLGARNFFVCPRGQEMVLKLSVVDPQELTFSARFSCVDEKKK